MSPPRLERRLGPFDATMIVMGGIVGSGIFINPSVVAREIHSSAMILGVWIAGGVIALLGALVYAELAAIHPQLGGGYAYLNYVVSVDFIFFGLTGLALFMLRKRAVSWEGEPGFRTPGHPVTTVLFIVACWLVVAATIWRYPMNSAIGLAILLLGIPAYVLWKELPPMRSRE